MPPPPHFSHDSNNRDTFVLIEVNYSSEKHCFILATVKHKMRQRIACMYYIGNT